MESFLFISIYSKDVNGHMIVFPSFSSCSDFRIDILSDFVNGLVSSLICFVKGKILVLFLFIFITL